MKKVRSYFAACMILTLLCVACGTAQTGTELTSAPDVTEAPSATETPAATEPPAGTEAPKATEAPAVTEAPVATKAPAATETPEATEAPAATEVPKATATPVPTATPKPTATPVPTKAPVKDGDVTYTFNDLKYVTSYGVNYTINKDGSIDLQYEGQWQEIKFRYPEEIDMTRCTGVTVKAKSEYGNICFKLLDKKFLSDTYCTEAFGFYECKGTGVKDYELQPVINGDLYGLGIMAVEVPADASAYKATIYSITFHMDDKSSGIADIKEAPTDQGDITYTFKDLKMIKKGGADYKVNEDGSLEISYDRLYGELRVVFPEYVDMSHCIGITVNLESLYTVSITFLGEDMMNNFNSPEICAMYGCNGKVATDNTWYPEGLGDVYGMGILAVDEVSNYSIYKTTINSITFHMASGWEKLVPKDIAPDVTEDMTLLNTYGTIFDNLGVTVCEAELQHPEILKMIKEDFNSVTLGLEMKAAWLLQGSDKLLTIAEAKKLGYVIPANYKETYVPLLDFSAMDASMKVCAENGLKMRAHTLIWHGSTPSWFLRTGYSQEGKYVSQEVMDARVEMYIRTVMEHIYNSPYGHVVNAWDVVNEYFHSTLANSEWVHIYGKMEMTPEYVKRAFEIADDVLKKYGIRDKVSLIFNDFSTFVVYNGVDTPECLLEIVRYINSEGKICDGIGMQAHTDISWGSPEDMRDAALKFLAEGLEVQVTELDIGIVSNTKPNEEKQMEKYAKIFRYFAEIKQNGGNITGFTIWGLADSIDARDTKAVLFSYPGRQKDVYYRVLQEYVEMK